VVTALLVPSGFDYGCSAINQKGYFLFLKVPICLQILYIIPSRFLCLVHASVVVFNLDADRATCFEHFIVVYFALCALFSVVPCSATFLFHSLVALD